MTQAPSQAAPRLIMRGMRKHFGATRALDGVDFEVHAGEVLALVGENGAGKSTLMKVLAGALQPDAGEMTLNGQAYAPRSPMDARRAGVAMIYQELSLAPHLSVAENVMLGVEPTTAGFIHWREMRDRVGAALKLLEHPDIHPRAIVGRLPVAAQQLTEIARALVITEVAGSGASHGGVIVLDEPTSSLGKADVERLFHVIDKLRDDGHAVVYISHFIEEVQRIADRYTVLRDGQSVGGGPVEGTAAHTIIEKMVGRTLDNMYPRSERTPGDTVLTVDHLAGKRLPQDASLDLRRGEVLGIAGLVGAGRSELLRAIFGLDSVRDGAIRFAGHVGPASPTRRLAQGMGLLSEDRKGEGLALNLTIGDNLTLSNLKGLGPANLIFPRRQDAQARRWIDKLAVRCQGPRQIIGNLSGGNQQKVAIARLLYHDVDVLLLDEPTRGIDVGSKAQIYQLIDELACSGKSVLLVSSYLPELMGVCDRIAVMHRGTLNPARPVSEIDEKQVMAQATGVHDTSNNHPNPV